MGFHRAPQDLMSTFTRPSSTSASPLTKLLNNERGTYIRRNQYYIFLKIANTHFQLFTQINVERSALSLGELISDSLRRRLLTEPLSFALSDPVSS